MLGAAFDGISIGLLVPVLAGLQDLDASADLPAFFAWILERLSRYPERQGLLIAISAVIIAILLKNAFNLLAVRAGHWMSTRVVADLRAGAMNRLLSVGLAFHDRSGAGKLIEQAVRNTEAVQNGIRMIVELSVNVLTFTALTILLFILSWQLALIAMVLGLVVFAVTSVYARSTADLGRRRADSGRGLMAVVHETLAGVRLIKSLSKEGEREPVVRAAIEADRDAEFRLGFRIYSIGPLTDILASAAIAVLFVVAWSAGNRDSAVILTQLLPFLYVLLRLAPLARSLQALKAGVWGLWPFVTIVRELLSEEGKPVVKDGAVDFTGLHREITFSAVHFTYEPDAPAALRGVDLRIPAGQTTALVGDSGAGKSTIVDLLLRLYDPANGSILVDGRPLSDFRLASYHDAIGVVSQDTFLFSDSLGANIGFGASPSPNDDQIRVAAARAGADGFIEALPEGYETEVGDRGVKLSGGQRQRVSLARALIRDPSILILDEATSALDSELERQVYDSIRSIGQDKTVIIVAHRLSSVRDADQVVVVGGGRVIESGPPDELLRRRGRFYELTRAQS